VTGWLVPFAGQMIALQLGWYLPPQKIPLAEKRFLQAGKGAENTKEKSMQCFTSLKSSLIMINANLNEPMRDDHPPFNFDAISTRQLLVLLLM